LLSEALVTETGLAMDARVITSEKSDFPSVS